MEQTSEPLDLESRVTIVPLTHYLQTMPLNICYYLQEIEIAFREKKQLTNQPTQPPNPKSANVKISISTKLEYNTTE